MSNRLKKKNRKRKGKLQQLGTNLPMGFIQNYVAVRICNILAMTHTNTCRSVIVQYIHRLDMEE